MAVVRAVVLVLILAATVWGWTPAQLMMMGGGNSYTETLRPTSDGQYDNWAASDAGANSALMVDDTTSDADTTYASNAAGARHAWVMSNVSTCAGKTIDSVTAHLLARDNGNHHTLYVTVRVGSTDAQNGGTTLTSSYADLSWAMTTDPTDSSAWTETDVNSLQVGPRHTVSQEARVTMAWAEVVCHD